MHFRSKGKGPEGNPPAPRQAGRPYLNKPGMPGWKRAEEEEGTSLPLTWAGATANKYQHFLNYLCWLTSCATDWIYYELFLVIYSPVGLRVDVCGSDKSENHCTCLMFCTVKGSWKCSQPFKHTLYLFFSYVTMRFEGLSDSIIYILYWLVQLFVEKLKYLHHFTHISAIFQPLYEHFRYI